MAGELPGHASAPLRAEPHAAELVSAPQYTDRAGGKSQFRHQMGVGAGIGLALNGTALCAAQAPRMKTCYAVRIIVFNTMHSKMPKPNCSSTETTTVTLTHDSMATRKEADHPAVSEQYKAIR